MKLWQRALTPVTDEQRSSFSMNDIFSFGGSNYPLGLNTTWQASSEEPPDASFQTHVDWAYKSSGPVFAAIAVRMRVFSEARFVFRSYGDDGRPSGLSRTPALSVLERPWPGGTTGDLLARMEQHGSLAGNCYVRKITDQGRLRLAILRPDWVTIMVGSQERPGDDAGLAADATVVGYMYKPGGRGSKAKAQMFLPDEIAHYAPTPDPAFHFRGMSWLTPVINEIRSDKAATTHKGKFFENAATPNLALKFDASVDMEQIQEVKALLESEHRGAWNAYKTLYLGGGADPVALGHDFQQMDFRNVQGIGETRIFEAAEVHAVIVGSAEGMQGSSLNSGNFSQVRRRFADGTMRPLWRNAAASLESIVTPPAGSHLWYDARDIAFLRQDAKEEAETFAQRVTSVVAAVRDGFTPDSAVASVGDLDLTKLVHTGLTSVQLQPPGSGEGEGAKDE